MLQEKSARYSLSNECCGESHLGNHSNKKGQFLEKLALFYISCLINSHVTQPGERHICDLHQNENATTISG